MRIALLAFCLALPGCHLIKVNAKVNTVTNINGETTKRSWKFKGTLDELPAALNEAYAVFEETGKELTAALEEAIKLPPAGKIRLRHISPKLKGFEGRDGVDFLNGPEARKAGKTFEYVRIGVPQVDQFFEASTSLYASAWQTRQSLHRASELVSKLKDADVDVGGQLIEEIASALKVKTTSANKPLKKKLRDLRAAIEILATVVPGMVQQVQKIVATGQALVVSAPTLITNPKVLLHIDAVKEGLVQSVEVVVQAGELLVGVVSEVFG